MRTAAFLILLSAGVLLADDAADVTKLDRQWSEATLHADASTLDRIMADDLRYVHGNGTVQNKQQFLADIKAGTMLYHSIDPAEFQVRVIGNAAVVTSSPRIKIKMGGQELDFTARFLRVYEKRNGTWRMVFHQATRLP